MSKSNRTLEGRIEKAGQRAGMIECALCHRWFMRQYSGIKTHRTSCKAKMKEKEDEEKALRRERRKERRALEEEFDRAMLPKPANAQESQHITPDLDITMVSDADHGEQTSATSSTITNVTERLEDLDWFEDVPPTQSQPPLIDSSQQPLIAVEEARSTPNSITIDPTPPTAATAEMASDEDWWKSGLCVRIHWHPSSHRPDEMYDLERYSEVRRRHNQPIPWNSALSDSLPAPDSSSPSKSNPYYPFSCLEDFEFSEFVSAAGLSNRQINQLLNYLSTSWTSNTCKITFKTHRDIQATIDSARRQTVRYEKHTVSGSYIAANGDKVKQEYAFWCRPLLPLVKDWFTDPIVGSVIEQYPSQRFLLHNGTVMDLIDDLDCGQDWWDHQESEDKIAAKGPGFLAEIDLHSDKTIIGRFEGETFHPVTMTCANIPHYLRNGHGIGGSLQVANLPIIETPKTKRKNTRFVDFKRCIMHKTFEVILESLATPVFGLEVQLPTGFLAVMYVAVYVFAADYEEATDIALTRGRKGCAPCTICEVPAAELDQRHATLQYRNAAENKDLYATTKSMLKTYGQITKAHRILTDKSLRPVRNAFWKLNFTDVHQILSFDLGHVFDSGMVKHILFAVFPALATRRKEKTIDEGIYGVIDDRNSLLQPYHHVHRHKTYEQITTKKFADQRDWESIYARILPSLHDGVGKVHMPDDDVKKVLRFMRVMGVIRKLMDPRAQTSQSLDQLSELLTELSESIPEISKILSKDFKFPKMHLLLDHALEHTRRKGPVKDLNSIYGERAHAILKSDYDNILHAGDTAEQISGMQEICYVLSHIRDRVTMSNAAEAMKLVDIPEAVELSMPPSTKTERQTDDCFGVSRGVPATLKSFCARLPALALERKKTGESSKQNAVFHGFRTELLAFLATASGRKHDLQKFDRNEVIETYSSVVCHYRSYNTLQITDVTARCDESFWNRERNDVVLLRFPSNHNRFPGRYCFARIYALVRCWAADQQWDVARVTWFKTVARPQTTSIGMRRIREDGGGSFVLTSWIIRTVDTSLTHDDMPYDRFVIDLTDGEAYLRLLHLESCSCI